MWELQKEVGTLRADAAVLALKLEAVEEGLRAIWEQGKGEDEDTYCRIRERASHLPFRGHPLAQVQSEEARRLYLLVLAKLALMDEDPSLKEDRLVVLQYLLSRSGLSDKLEDIVRMALESKDDVFKNLNDVLEQAMYKHLAVDALVMAHIQGEASEAALCYASGLCAVLGIQKDSLKIYMALAASVLEQKLDEQTLSSGQKESFLYELQSFTYYLEQYRVVALTRNAQIFDANTNNPLTWHVKSGEMVICGQSICTGRGVSKKANRIGKVYIFKSGIKQEVPREGISPSESFFYGLHDFVQTYCIVICPPYDSRQAVLEWIKGTKVLENPVIC